MMKEWVDKKFAEIMADNPHSIMLLSLGAKIMSAWQKEMVKPDDTGHRDVQLGNRPLLADEARPQSGDVLTPGA